MVTRIYYEGDRALREGFGRLFAKVSPSSRLKWVAGKSTAETRKRFELGRASNPEDRCLLLIDQEDLTSSRGASEFWMVQLMEAWFLADPEALKRYYGEGFQASALPRRPNVEEIPKDDVTRALRNATVKTTKGKYHKTAHGPDLLGVIDPTLLRRAAQNCDLLFQAVE